MRSWAMAEYAKHIPDLQQRKKYIETIPNEDQRSWAIREYAKDIPDLQQRKKYIETIPDEDQRSWTMAEYSEDIPDLQQRKKYIETIPGKDMRSWAMMEYAKDIPDLQQRKKYIETIPDEDQRSWAMREYSEDIPDLQQRKKYIETIPNEDQRSWAMREYAKHIPDLQQRKKYIETIPNELYRSWAMRECAKDREQREQRKKYIKPIVSQIQEVGKIRSLTASVPPRIRFIHPKEADTLSLLYFIRLRRQHFTKDQWSLFLSELANLRLTVIISSEKPKLTKGIEVGLTIYLKSFRDFQRVLKKIDDSQIQELGYMRRKNDKIVSRASTEHGIQQFLARLPGHIHEHEKLQDTQISREKTQSMKSLDPQIRSAHKKRETRNFFLNLLQDSRTAQAFRKKKSHRSMDEITDTFTS